jgi:hypothetical protein
MRQVQTQIAGRGATATHWRIHTPICAPSRSELQSKFCLTVHWSLLTTNISRRLYDAGSTYERTLISHICLYRWQVLSQYQVRCSDTGNTGDEWCYRACGPGQGLAVHIPTAAAREEGLRNGCAATNSRTSGRLHADLGRVLRRNLCHICAQGLLLWRCGVWDSALFGKCMNDGCGPNPSAASGIDYHQMGAITGRCLVTSIPKLS